MPRIALLLVAAIVATPLTSAGAQVRLPRQTPIRQLTPAPASDEETPQIPTAYRPPPGMCRIWLEGVPPAQQPAPTDCPTAVRNRPNNGRVIFGDDYVDKRRRGKDQDRDKDRDKDRDRRPEARTETTPAVPATSELFVMAGEGRTIALGHVAGTHGPQADEPFAESVAPNADAPVVVALAQPPARRDSVRGRVRRDSTLSERRRALREERRRDARDDEPDDERDDERPGDRRDDRVARGYYPPYAPPARANGVCLDRDGDGWCDDVRAGSQYCLDRDGDGRCDDYPELASAPYSSSMPPMRAALEVRNGNGSQAALRWLGTAEVLVRTSELRRTGTPHRAMWLDASTNRLLQVWTDRDGDGIADRVEIYRNGRVAKIIGR